MNGSCEEGLISFCPSLPPSHCPNSVSRTILLQACQHIEQNSKTITASTSIVIIIIEVITKLLKSLKEQQGLWQIFAFCIIYLCVEYWQNEMKPIRRVNTSAVTDSYQAGSLSPPPPHPFFFCICLLVIVCVPYANSKIADTFMALLYEALSPPFCQWTDWGSYLDCLAISCSWHMTCKAIHGGRGVISVTMIFHYLLSITKSFISCMPGKQVTNLLQHPPRRTFSLHRRSNVTVHWNL